MIHKNVTEREGKMKEERKLSGKMRGEKEKNERRERKK